jgi:hypothetical protein
MTYETSESSGRDPLGLKFIGDRGLLSALNGQVTVGFAVYELRAWIDQQYDRIDTMTTYPLVVIQYPIFGHLKRTEHWSIVAMKSRQEAYVFEVVGNYDTYTYVPRFDSALGYSQETRGGCQVGAIAVEKLDWLKTRLRDIRVVRHDTEFDCQTWVMDAVRMLKHDGVGITNVSERSIRAELAREVERWEVAEDTIEERLFEARG